MVGVPLGAQAYDRQRGIVPEVVLKNYYLEEDESGGSLDGIQRLQRPGETFMVDFPGEIRGIYQLDGVLDDLVYVVAGDKLYSTDLANKTLLGTVPDDGLPVAMAANNFRLGIVSAGEFWTWDGSDLNEVELPDGRVPIDLDVLNGYFILPMASGRFYWLDPSQEDFSSPEAILQFATAESIPDGLHAVRRNRDEFFLFGPRSIEVWQPTGDANATFERAQGRTIDRGVQARGSIVQFDNSVVYVGDDGLVYRQSDVPVRISTHGIEERITKRTNDCSAFVMTIEGHAFYVLHIPGQGTFAYDASTELWSEFSSIGKPLWNCKTAIITPSGVIGGDAEGNLFKIDPAATTDMGQPIERVVSGTVAIPLARVANSQLAIWIGAEDNAEITLRWKDGRDVEWSAERKLIARAGSDIVYARRLGATRGAFRTFEIATTANSFVRISGAVANEGRAAG